MTKRTLAFSVTAILLFGTAPDIAAQTPATPAFDVASSRHRSLTRSGKRTVGA
jgi:hypothetical protein